MRKSFFILHDPFRIRAAWRCSLAPYGVKLTKEVEGRG
jgi:hypothetical protein